MTFTSLLTSLQSLISTRLTFAYFLPSMAFWFAHGAMLFWLNAPFHDFVAANVDATAGLISILVGSALIGVAVFSFAAASLLPTIQGLMEGNWPHQRLVSWFAGWQ